MRRLLLVLATAAALGLAAFAAFARYQPQPKGCLLFVSKNLVNGNGNWYTYYRFSDLKMTVKPGDVLVYDVMLDPANPEPKGGIDVDFQDGGEALRGLPVKDEQGLRAHGDALLPAAVGKWLTRRFPLDAANGRTTSSWNLVFEGDKGGRYAQFVADVAVLHADGTRTQVYDGGKPVATGIVGNNAYTRRPSLSVVPRPETAAEVEPVIARALRAVERFAVVENAADDADVVLRFLQSGVDPAVKARIDKALAQAEKVAGDDNASPDDVKAPLAELQDALKSAKPIVSRYNAHLVGHGHIDPQWLWDWDEGIVATRDTFAQALKFMNEYPGFTYTQSSASLYMVMEGRYPALFSDLRKRAREGRFEIVGGRMVEGDTNLVSSESHARQFLYAQRYFRDKFGRTARVAWEPDTFGHTAQMPQIVRLGGCESYYFCRGGVGKPLFWWEGLDGSRVLAYDEVATGGWYGGDLGRYVLTDMIPFEKATGSKDSLAVYGVGNHGGGPTRESIDEAVRWQMLPYMPNTKFSTATEFFRKARMADTAKWPVVKSELNHVFDGCYTSHAEIKRLNRDAEASLASAEAAATVAALFGAKYPTADFKELWHEVLLNQHHDTLGGSGVAKSYPRTRETMANVVGVARDAGAAAVESLAASVKVQAGAPSVIVFNPTGWTRSDWVSLPAGAMVRFHAGTFRAFAPDGRSWPVEGRGAASRFFAADVPPFGYRVFRIKKAKSNPGALKADSQKLTVESDRLIVQFDGSNGSIKRLYDKKAKREFVRPGGVLGAPELHYETPGSMSAWTITGVARVGRPMPAAALLASDGDRAVMTFAYRIPSVNNAKKETVVRQEFIVHTGSPNVEMNVQADWQMVGKSDTENPMLRFAFDSPVANPVASYDVPFGVVARPVDGREEPALKWADLGDQTCGVAVLNDAVHGHSAKGETLRVSLIRSSFDPDPLPNPGLHFWRFVIVPRTGSWQAAGMQRLATNLNQPMLSALVKPGSKGAKPLQWSLGGYADPAVVTTGLKMAEDGSGVVLRAYEGFGKPSKGVLTLTKPVKSATWVDFLEDSMGAAALNKNQVAAPMRPWEIRTVKVKFAP